MVTYTYGTNDQILMFCLLLAVINLRVPAIILNQTNQTHHIGAATYLNQICRADNNFEDENFIIHTCNTNNEKAELKNENVQSIMFFMNLLIFALNTRCRLMYDECLMQTNCYLVR